MTRTAYTPVTAPIPERPAQLTEISSPHEIASFLRDPVALSLSELAETLRADERTIRRLLGDPDARAVKRHARRLDDLRDVVSLLQETLPGEQTGRWLRARNRGLDGRRPLEVIANDDYDAVKRAAEIYVDGDPM